MAMRKNEDGAAAGRVAKVPRAQKRVLDRSKKKVRAYCTRVVIPFGENDSMTAKFMSAALGKKGASIASRQRMRTTFIALEEFAKKNRWGKVDPTNLTFKQFRTFILSRIGVVVDFSVQNEASHIRRALGCVGRAEFAAVTCSKEALGVPSASRISRAKVINLDVFAAALGKARADTRALLLLEQAIGLRGKEAVQCRDSLQEWKRAIAAGQPVTVRYGTKGGRVRSVFLCPSKAAEAAAAVDAALKVLEGQKYLVESANLKAALATNHRRMKKIGISGKDAQHGNRRGFALGQFDYYRGELQMTEKQALATLSNDLGHGDRRGRWVYNCYLRATLEEREAALAAQASKAAE